MVRRTRSSARVHQELATDSRDAVEAARDLAKKDRRSSWEMLVRQRRISLWEVEEQDKRDRQWLPPREDEGVSRPRVWSMGKLRAVVRSPRALRVT